jgi:hypothetical protein
MNGIAASRRLSAGEARNASSHSRARRAIWVTDSTVSSGVNASRIRTARVSTDSPDTGLAIYGNYQRPAARAGSASG